MGTQLNYESYQKLIDEDILALNNFMPENSLEKNHIIEVLQWSIKEIYGDNDGVLKKCVITRYDKTIKKPPYLTIPIDEVEVFQPVEDKYGEKFSDRLYNACRKKGYYFKFYTMWSESDKYDYEIVVE